MSMDNTNQQIPPVQNTEQSHSAPLPNPSNPSKIFILIFIAVLTVIGIVGYVLGSRKNQTVNQQTITISPTVSQPSPTATPDETANWKTYTNKKYNYSVAYPSTWILREEPNVSFSSPINESTANGTLINGGTIVIFVDNNRAFTNKSLTTIDALYDFYKNVYSNKSQTDFIVTDRKYITVSGEPALRYIAEAPGLADGTMVGTMVVYKNDIYRIDVNYGKNNKQEVIELFDQILSTFKFTP